MTERTTTNSRGRIEIGLDGISHEREVVKLPLAEKSEGIWLERSTASVADASVAPPILPPSAVISSVDEAL